MSAAAEARRFLRGHVHGVLSTRSQMFPGYPFGSLVPYATDHASAPIILISALAEHTRNLTADPRASLLVYEPDQSDVQASVRITILGEARPAEDVEAASRYLARFPEAKKVLALGDFEFFRIAPHAIRYIGGFGHIHWEDPDAFTPQPNTLAKGEKGVLDEMNAHHRTALLDYCRHFFGVTAEQATMTAVDCDGFEIRVDDRRFRFAFAHPVSNAAEARETLFAMARDMRG